MHNLLHNGSSNWKRHNQKKFKSTPIFTLLINRNNSLTQIIINSVYFGESYSHTNTCHIEIKSCMMLFLINFKNTRV